MIEIVKKNKRFNFTDIHYSTPKEIKENTLKEEFDKVFKQEMNYRKNHLFQLPVTLDGKQLLFIIQTPWILQKEIFTITNTSATQRRILHKIGKEHNIPVLLKDLYDKKIVEDISYLLDRMELGVGKYNIENLINKTSTPDDPHEEQAIKYYNHLLAVKRQQHMPDEVNKMFFKSKFRATKVGGKKESLFGAELNQSYNELTAAIQDAKINSYIVKASILYFLLKKNYYFESGNYRTLVISLYSFFNQTFFKDSLNAIVFFKLFQNEQEWLDEAYMNTLNNKGDLTYIYLAFLKIFQQMDRLAIRSIDDFMENDAQEFISMTKTEKILTSQQVMFKYPELSERAAQFYVTHNNLNHNYTIQNFKEYVGSSYEMARYSLEKLVKINLYEKQKIGKKYVYKPK